MNRRTVIRACSVVLIGAGLVFGSLSAFAVISGGPRGDWPRTWPKELDRFREDSYSIHSSAKDLMEVMYEIKFREREEFESAWPHILKLKSPGAPLILVDVGGDSRNVLGSMVVIGGPLVRVYSSEYGYYEPDGGWELMIGEPWSNLDPEQKERLPEYVTPSEDGKSLVEFNPADIGKKMRIRARVELELAVDGEIVDLNRIRLPADTPIIDRRKFR